MEQTTLKSEAFLALSRICLNNWHYISKKTLSFNRDINFFTGHSGSGKSTVIDAMQLVLYANTDGRGFFNKAAADDSDRSLIEYLRGMVNIGENNQFSYLRNKNFSSTIVLELSNTESGQCQCVGVVFDVDTASNEVSRRFFWHRGPLWENEYRTDTRTMSIKEVTSYLEANYGKEEFFSTSHNERFRKVLYDCYLGGLDSEKFPLLFKRAIPFRMNIKLEDFVKEYICTDQDIHIEDMQESVLQYGRMRKRIEDTCREIEALTSIKESHQTYEKLENEIEKYTWFAGQMELLSLKEQVRAERLKAEAAKEDLEKQEKAKAAAEEQIAELTGRSDELLRRIASTGYEELKSQLVSLNELIERLGHSEAGWQKTSAALKAWEEEDTVSNQTLWDMEEFQSRTITEDGISRLKLSLESLRADAEKQRQEAVSAVNSLKKQEKQLGDELDQLKSGNKAYPKRLEEARHYIERRLLEETGKGVGIYVLADLLEVPREEWRSAVEGYLGNNKCNLIVAPKYAKEAIRIYGELEKNLYYSVAVLDTEKAAEQNASRLEHSLAEEVTVKESYLAPYVDFLLGKVVKCRSVEELRSCRTGITPDCMLYHNFRLQYINPDNYTKYAYIGKDSVRKRIRLLVQELEKIKEEMALPEQAKRDADRLLALESLSKDTGEYVQWLRDMESRAGKLKEQKKLLARLEVLKAQNVAGLEKEREAVLTLCDGKKRERDSLQELMAERRQECGRTAETISRLEELLLEKEREQEKEELTDKADYEKELSAYLSKKENPRWDKERDSFQAKCAKLAEEHDRAREELFALRGEYLRKYPNRNFSLSARDNASYDRLLTELSCDHLEEYRKKAASQAKAAVLHFKDDFIYKIRSAIKEALQRKDELNRIINRLDFGKDRYQFVIGKSRGAEGRYYDMFMDESLEVNPADLNQSFDNQMNLFTMEHENQYGEEMNELISMFIPPDNATADELEEARRNMEKYSDYRTYLSFDMQQLIRNEDEVIKIRLSKMIKKNSGGEGQNPLYVALLASFAQAYHINQPGRGKRNPTIRLVVLDEAFSKMDAEKVASCIELIRGLGFQAIISATNDKIQNYVENVDKTFVFANPNKKSISIQEFEKRQFSGLVKDLEG